MKPLSHRITAGFLALCLAAAAVSCNARPSPSTGNAGSSNPSGAQTNPSESGSPDSENGSNAISGNVSNTNATSSGIPGSGDSSGSLSQSVISARGSSSIAPTRSTVNSSKPEVSNGSDLHASSPDYRIGDVHPFYDVKTQKWFMFFLYEKGGTYAPKLMTSKDMIVWEPVEIRFNKTAPMQTYYVLSVLESNGTYYSYFGNGYTVQSSKSSDLLNWEYSKGTNIPNDQVQYPAGARDPYVFYDPDNKIYRCITTAYHTNQNLKFGSGMDVAIAISSTDDNTLTSWQWEQRDLLRFPNGFSGEPECSQMFKLGAKWYLSSSLLRRTDNVGCFTYWIGDQGAKIDQVNWQKKSENTLDSDDLCAPQTTMKGGKYYLWGWIPNSASGGWGGSLCLSREIYSLSSGKLAIKLAGEISSAIRGRLLFTKENFQVSSTPVHLQSQSKRSDLEIKTNSFSGSLSVGMNHCTVVIDKQSGKIICKSPGGNTVYSTAALSAPLGNENIIRIITEGNIVEVFVNDQSSLCARTAAMVDASGITLTAGNVDVKYVKIYRLKYREEI